MKTNPYLENCRRLIVEANQAMLQGEPSKARVCLIQAIHELDAFSHGPLQRIDDTSIAREDPET